MSIEICQELHQNFIDFSYEANSQRAFPSALDGLKPGQRACLWEFYSKKYNSSKPHVKSAKISGGVIASWWPHGNVAIYDTFARMSQPWINNIPEVDFHGGNGSQIGGPECASERYTEARLSKAAEEGYFENFNKNCVQMIPNFSEDDEWPAVLPAIFPRLFVNGSQGIGVTIAQTWLPGNLNEFEDKVKQFIETGDITYDNIYPDFPTGGIIINSKDLPTIYKTGKGKAVLRAKTSIEGNSILIHELPYQVYVEPFIDSVKDLVIKEELHGIKEIYNKSDKHRMLIEIECESAPLAVLNKLFSCTELQKSFSANQYALVSKVPEMLNLKQYINVYIKHNIECINKEYEHTLEKSRARQEIVEGLVKALEHIDNIIALIKASESSAEAKVSLMKKYDFTENQAKAIIDMKLGRLAHLEAVELNEEKAELDKTIANCLEFLASQKLQNDELLTRLAAFVKKYGWTRRTQITQIDETKAAKEDKEIAIVEPEKCVVIITESGLIKRVPAASFKTQKRAGKGVKSKDDIADTIIRTNTIDQLMIFTSGGMMYRLLVNDIPVGTNTTKGVSISSLIEFNPGETVQTIYSIYRETDAKYVLFITKNGTAKKTTLEEYLKTKKKTGIQALNFREGDSLAEVTLIKDEEMFIVTRKGFVVRMRSTDISASGRLTVGVKGINLTEGDEVVAVLPIRDATDDLAVFSEYGIGKRIPIKEFSLQGRGTRGLMCYKMTEATGNIAAATLVSDDDMVLVAGVPNSICIKGSDITVGSRSALGSQIIKGSKILSVSKV